MFKSLAICAAALLIAGCNQQYPSMRQAIQACEEWKAEYKIDENGMKIRKRRWCELEKETNQSLGYEKGEVVKHFRYY